MPRSVESHRWVRKRSATLGKWDIFAHSIRETNGTKLILYRPFLVETRLLQFGSGPDKLTWVWPTRSIHENPETPLLQFWSGQEPSKVRIDWAADLQRVQDHLQRSVFLGGSVWWPGQYGWCDEKCQRPKRAGRVYKIGPTGHLLWALLLCVPQTQIWTALHTVPTDIGVSLIYLASSSCGRLDVVLN